MTDRALARCDNCRYFMPGKPIPQCRVSGEILAWVVAQGGCRRLSGPPPDVYSDHWCGEYESSRAARAMLEADL
jgi:hypothetical protein